MEQNIRHNDYREHLLSALRSDRGSRTADEGGSLHVLVDQEGIGTLDCAGAGATLAFESREHPLHLVEVRTESGRLVGGLCVPENGTKAVRLEFGRAKVELSVQATLDRCTVRAISCPGRPVFHRIRSMAGSLAGGIRHQIRTWGTPAHGGVPGASPAAPPAALWTRVGVLAQGVLALAVLALVGDRLRDFQGMQEREVRITELSGTIARQQTATGEALEALARQEQRLAKIVASQGEVARALRAQKREIGGLQRVAENVERFARTHREAETFFLTRLNDAAAERSQIHDQLRGVSVSNENLGREVAHLQVRTVVTEARLSNQVQSFQFWVSFQDGIPEERIDQWVREIRGHKGPVNAGWYSVEVEMPKSQFRDRLLKSLQQDTDIVRAVSLSLDVSANPRTEH